MMKRFQQPFVLLLSLVLVIGGSSLAWAATSSKPASGQPSGKPAKAPPGVEVAQTLSTVTGVAISPLLGVGAVGCYQYWKAPVEQRTGLPWFAQPWFWGPALLLVALVALKDVVGTAAPMVLKKPFDVAEAVENKISALVAAGAFIPLIIAVFPDAAGGESLAPDGLGFASIGLGSVGNALLVPFALAVFAVVWMASHAINILIILSPFTTVDTALKSLRVGLLSLVTATSFTNPYLGAVVSVVIILFSYLIAGWSFRLTVFGTVYIWDYFTFRRYRFQPAADSNPVFTARKIEGVPVRTYGKLSVTAEGSLCFAYRPLLVLKTRTFVLPKDRYVVGRGLFCPEIDRVAGDKTQAVFILPPRYLTHEDALARVCQLPEVRDIGVLKGMKAAWRWLKSLFKSAPEMSPVPEVPAAP